MQFLWTTSYNIWLHYIISVTGELPYFSVKYNRNRMRRKHECKSYWTRILTMVKQLTAQLWRGAVHMRVCTKIGFSLPWICMPGCSAHLQIIIFIVTVTVCWSLFGCQKWRIQEKLSLIKGKRRSSCYLEKWASLSLPASPPPNTRVLCLLVISLAGCLVWFINEHWI